MDERHLWPDFYRLIAECRPATLFGEQVASNDGLEWLDGISLDLEELDYAFAAADLPAACVGSPQERQRLWWVADAEYGRSSKQEPRAKSWASRRGSVGRLDDANLPSEHGRTPSRKQSVRHKRNGRDAAVGDATGEGQQEQWREYRPRGEGSSGLVGLAMQVGVPEWNGPTIAVKCSDGSRRISAQPGAFPLAHGLSARMGRLRGYGNAIVPQVAAKFIEAYLATESAATPSPSRQHRRTEHESDVRIANNCDRPV
jgi:DNA (cytosine-5)-methyltransferase 1